MKYGLDSFVMFLTAFIPLWFRFRLLQVLFLAKTMNPQQSYWIIRSQALKSY